jgi:hypothetical protein
MAQPLLVRLYLTRCTVSFELEDILGALVEEFLEEGFLLAQFLEL